METPTALNVSGLHVSYHQQPVLSDFSLSLQEGNILCLLGPSGCGKTTALKALAGLIASDRGDIELAGQTVAGSRHVPAEKRNIGFIFQDYALFPHMSVEKNIAYGLSHMPKAERDERIRECLALVELDDLGHRYPHELSGGQQQRIAVARALAPKPQLLLMDEPFSNIDTQVKRRMMTDLRKLLKSHNISCIFVTHAKDEAFAFADETAVMIGGRIRQKGHPATVLNYPADTDTAHFMESGNIASVSFSQQVLDQPYPGWKNAAEKTGYWVFRPDNISVTKSQQKNRAYTDRYNFYRSQLSSGNITS